MLSTEVRPSTAVAVSVKPAFADLTAASTSCIAVSVSAPAEMAWYNASLISVPATPVSLDKVSTSSLISLTLFTAVSAIVLTLAREVSKAVPNL